jgi:O-antigen/teichoic acid export membrane protein
MMLILLSLLSFFLPFVDIWMSLIALLKVGFCGVGFESFFFVGKARLGKLVNLKTATCVAITEVKKEVIMVCLIFSFLFLLGDNSNSRYFVINLI